MKPNLPIITEVLRARSGDGTDKMIREVHFSDGSIWETNFNRTNWVDRTEEIKAFYENT